MIHPSLVLHLCPSPSCFAGSVAGDDLYTLCLIHWTFCFQLSHFFFYRIWIFLFEYSSIFLAFPIHIGDFFHPFWQLSLLRYQFSSTCPVPASSFIRVCKRCPFWGHSSFLLVGFCGIFLSSFPVAMWECFGKSNVKEKAYFSSQLKTPIIEGESRQWALGAACRIAPMIRK